MTMDSLLNTEMNFSTTTTLPLNSTSNNYVPYVLEWSSEVIYRVVTLIIVMAATLVGNITLIVLLMKNPKHRRKRVNVFLVNLAIGDLMVCVVTMTTEIFFIAFGEWVLGAVACKLLLYGQIVTLASATFLLVGMSIDRYQVIVKPLQSLTNNPWIWRKVAVAWVMALVFASPQLLIFVQTDEGMHPDGNIIHECKSQGYTAMWQRKLYFTFLTTYILIIPSIIMTYCYVNIIRVVWSRNKGDAIIRNNSTTIKANDAGPNLNLNRKLISNSKVKAVKMTLTVIIAFVACWAPYLFITLVRIYSNYKVKLKMGQVVAETLTLIHSALNPILYGLFNSKCSFTHCCPCLSWSTNARRTDGIRRREATQTTDCVSNNKSIPRRHRPNRWLPSWFSSRCCRCSKSKHLAECDKTQLCETLIKHNGHNNGKDDLREDVVKLVKQKNEKSHKMCLDKTINCKEREQMDYCISTV